MLLISKIAGIVAIVALLVVLATILMDITEIGNTDTTYIFITASVVLIVAVVVWLIFGLVGENKRIEEETIIFNEEYNIVEINPLNNHQGYKYIIDVNTGIVYIKAQKSLAPAYNKDGSIMTREDLEKMIDK
jgi:ABC-type nickel/cobalt efflux system permease component RcnA